MRLFRRKERQEERGYPVAFDHPAQALAASFLRAVASDQLATLWDRLSLESRGLLEGRYAARASLALKRAAGVGEEEADERLEAVAGPFRDAVANALGGEQKVNAVGVSAARLVSRGEVFVLLLPNVAQEGFATEEEWRPAHLLAFRYEEREWRVNLGRTAALSEEAGLPDPLGDLL